MSHTGLRRTLLAASLSLTGCGLRFDYGHDSPLPLASDAVACEGLPRATGATGIPVPVIDSIQRLAESTLSDELVIVRDGRIVHHWRHPDFRDTLFNPQSVTKAVAALGVGLLLDDGRIPSLDLALRDVFPALDTPDKSALTLRMLMAHTSGIAAGRGEAQFRGQGDVEAFILGQPMAEPAGTTFRYNNLGAQLMGQVVQARSGQPLARLLESRVFLPLCIRQWTWDHDARGATYAYSRVHLRAVDLAAIGQLMLDGGAWRGSRVLSAAAVDTLTHLHGARGVPLAATSFAASWMWSGDDRVVLDRAWLARLEATSASPALREAARRLVVDTAARAYPTTAFKAVLDTAFGSTAQNSTMPRWYRETSGRADPERVRGPARLVMHSGSWGQYLLVYPETRTVVVRYASWQHDGRRDEDDAGVWGSIAADLYRLVGRAAR